MQILALPSGCIYGAVWVKVYAVLEWTAINILPNLSRLAVVNRFLYLF